MAIKWFPVETLLQSYILLFCVWEKEKEKTSSKDSLHITFYVVIPESSAHIGSFSQLHAEWIWFADKKKKKILLVSNVKLAKLASFYLKVAIFTELVCSIGMGIIVWFQCLYPKAGNTGRMRILRKPGQGIPPDRRPVS